MTFVPRQQPFWRDEPVQPVSIISSNRYFRWISILLRFSTAIFIHGLILFMFYLISPILMAGWFVFLVSVYGWAALGGKRKRKVINNIVQIQEDARARSGASLIGSAIHVAGHPLLEREQPTVLALNAEGLEIYSYENPDPIDEITLDRISSIHTVVYDDERTPHIDTVDSTAQALQMSFTLKGKDYTCLFRTMRKVRPIDWYQELQKARWQN